MNEAFKLIIFKAREDVYSHLSGGNLAKKLGEGYDFSELREYDSSDDIRHISWINSAKLGEPYVKKLHEEKELRVAVCSLHDGRLLVGKKRELLHYATALLAYATYEGNNLFSSILLTSTEEKIYAPTKNIYTIEKMLEESYALNLLAERVDYGQLSTLRVEERQLLFIVGDFLDRVDLSLLAQQHEVIVIMIRDELEENPTLLLNEQLVNPQSNRPINQTLTKKAIKHYREKMQEHDAWLLEHFNSNAIKHIKVTNQMELLVQLEVLFN